MTVKTKGRLGSPVDLKRNIIKGPPPLIFAVQPDSYFEIHTPEELDAWEEDIKTAIGGAAANEHKTGATPSKLRAAMRYGYSCSGGCVDDCCQF